MTQEIHKALKEKMDICLNHFQKGLTRIRTGRASASLLDNIKVEYYGNTTPLQQIANITTPDSQTIAVQPWDISAMKEIIKGIQSSDLGLNPVDDGKMIRISIPSLTGERRKELTKIVKKEVEECKVALRNVRREYMDSLKNLEKEKEISKDDLKKGQDDIQSLTDTYVKKADDIGAKKEKEIMEE
ncbi:MAG: ribosome recycling factor [Spirochaetes bacterium]|nr:ribosome recycling factor [Spirochaetota bacterium]